MCILIGAVLIFIFIPRDIQITNNITYISPYNVTYIKNDVNGSILGLIIYFNENFIINNENFYSVEITDLELEITTGKDTINPEISYEKAKISPRTTSQLFVKIKYTMFVEDDQYAG